MLRTKFFFFKDTFFNKNLTNFVLFFVDLQIIIIHILLVNPFGFFFFLLGSRLIFLSELPTSFYIILRFLIIFLILETIFFFFIFKKKKIRRFMINRYTYERLTCFVDNTAIKSAVTKGVAVLCAAGGIEVITSVTETITKNLEMEALVKNTTPVIDKFTNAKKKQEGLVKLFNTTVDIAQRPTHGIVTKSMQTETTQHLINTSGKTIGKFFGFGR